MDIVDGNPETYNNTIKRELMEEALNDDKSKAIESVRGALDTGTTIYSGFVNDPRTTDNAWIETVCVHAHIGERVANELNIKINIH